MLLCEQLSTVVAGFMRVFASLVVVKATTVESVEVSPVQVVVAVVIPEGSSTVSLAEFVLADAETKVDAAESVLARAEVVAKLVRAEVMVVGMVSIMVLPEVVRVSTVEVVWKLVDTQPTVPTCSSAPKSIFPRPPVIRTSLQISTGLSVPAHCLPSMLVN